MPETHARMVESVQTKSKRYPAVKTYLQRCEGPFFQSFRTFCIEISTKVKIHRHSTIETSLPSPSPPLGQRLLLSSGRSVMYMDIDCTLSYAPPCP